MRKKKQRLEVVIEEGFTAIISDFSEIPTNPTHPLTLSSDRRGRTEIHRWGQNNPNVSCIL